MESHNLVIEITEMLIVVKQYISTIYHFSVFLMDLLYSKIY